MIRRTLARPKAGTLGLLIVPAAALALGVPTLAMAADPSPTLTGCVITTAGGGSEVGDVVRVATGANPLTGSCTGLTGNRVATEVTWTSGTNGTNGVSGYKVVRTSVKIGANRVSNFTVNCPSGKAPVGGGAKTAGRVDVRSSSISTDGRGWQVRISNPTGTQRSAVASVICATV